MRSVGGFCNACYQYRNSNDKERPSRLFPNSWCECGSLATHTIKTNLGLFYVCNECYEFEKDFLERGGEAIERINF